VTDIATAETAISGAYTDIGRVSREVKALADYGVSTSLILGEQMDILWWLYSERSLILNRQFAECDAFEAVAAAGIELASLTRILPGPVASSAFLRRALGPHGGKPAARGKQMASALMAATTDPSPAVADFTPLVTYVRSGGKLLSAESAVLASELYDEILLVRSVTGG